MAKSSFPTLNSARLHLRRASRDDVDRYYVILSDPRVTKYINLPDSPSLERVEKFVRWMRKAYASGKACAWLIQIQGEDQVIGAIRIDRISRSSVYGTIGYELHPDYWGKGYASEAVTAVCDCAFGQFGLNRLEAWTLPGNESSDKVLVKCGFSYEGTLRQRSKFKGRFHDLRMYGYLAQEHPSKT